MRILIFPHQKSHLNVRLCAHCSSTHTHHTLSTIYSFLLFIIDFIYWPKFTVSSFHFNITIKHESHLNENQYLKFCFFFFVEKEKERPISQIISAFQSNTHFTKIKHHEEEKKSGTIIINRYPRMLKLWKMGNNFLESRKLLSICFIGFGRIRLATFGLMFINTQYTVFLRTKSHLNDDSFLLKLVFFFCRFLDFHRVCFFLLLLNFDFHPILNFISLSLSLSFFFTHRSQWMYIPFYWNLIVHE